MARYALDAPTLLHLVRQHLLPHPSHQLVAPHAIRPDAMGLLYQAVRRGELTERDALALHDVRTGLRMRLLGDRGSRGMAWRIAREQDWAQLGDAEYLAVARLQADAFVSVDERMRALAEGIVATAPVDALLAP